MSLHKLYRRTCYGLVAIVLLVSRLRASVQINKPERRISDLKKVCGVITTILEINQAVVHATTNTSMSLVVVGDLKTNHVEWTKFQANSGGAVVYLSPTDQRRLPFHIMRHIPWNHFGRKSIGFLYAVAGGCEKIYDFDDDNHLNQKNGLDSHDDWSYFRAVRARSNGIHVFNPYAYFRPNGTKLVWPRGFPLQFIRDERTYHVGSAHLEEVPIDASNAKVAIVQSLANHDPDVDAIYRLTQSLPITFNRQGTVLIPERGLYTPWNAQAVLISYPAFFGMLLPVTVTGRVSDIWRSYITTRLLWETGFNVAFTSPFVTQFRNPHNYMVDFLDEDDLYKRVDELLSVLSSWTSKQFQSLDAAYLDLVTHLVKVSGILGHDDLLLARAWVKDLQEAGYVWPKILRRMDKRHHTSAPVVDERKVGEVP